jgi:hypothetical protein
MTTEYDEKTRELINAMASMYNHFGYGVNYWGVHGFDLLPFACLNCGREMYVFEEFEKHAPKTDCYHFCETCTKKHFDIVLQMATICRKMGYRQDEVIDEGQKEFNKYEASLKKQYMGRIKYIGSKWGLLWIK